MTEPMQKYTVADLETMPAIDAYRLVMELPNVDRMKLLAEILENNPELHADIQAQEGNVSDDNTGKD